MRFVSDHLTIILLVLAALIMLALLALVISAARRDGARGGAASANALRLLGAAAVRVSFRRAVKLIERNLATRAERYNLSWAMLINESSGAALPLHASGLQSALSEEAGLRAAAQGLDWNFFDQGVVVQLRSAYLGGADTDGVWDDLIGLCRKYRPQRPLDCIVLAMPAALLADASPDGQHRLLARAKSLHRRLWLAQNRLALRFPIHIVISECETIPGFASFAAALPGATQRSILGWASPHELAAPYRAQWVDSALDQVRGAIADSCAELCALESGDSDSSAYFLLASQVETLRAGLALFCDELMQPSVYHESFLLRGVYLTGDCGDAALLGAAAGAAPESMAAMPAFLRDIFERKIFAEVGLVQSSAQRLRKPAVKRLGWALAFMAPLLWAAGLVWATLDLNRQSTQLLAILTNADSGANRPGMRPETRTLDQFAALGDARLRSVFMPGSWSPAFGDIQEDLDRHLRHRFAEAAVPELHDAAQRKLSALTQAAGLGSALQTYDPDSCDLLMAPSSPAATLNLASMPEYIGLVGYLDALSPLAKAIAAIERLEQAETAGGASPAPAALGRDLAEAVKLLFGYRLADAVSDRGATLERMALLYRKAALSAARRNAPLTSMTLLRGAALCALQRRGANLKQQLFDNNALLRSQEALAAGIAGVQDDALSGTDLQQQLHRWQALRAALDAQQNLMTPGQGAWMAQRQMQLGAAYPALLKLIRENPLLGPTAQADFDSHTRRHFERFMSQWREAERASGAFSGAATLAWSAENKVWTATPEHEALRDAVKALLTRPYVNAGVAALYAVAPPGTAVVWDHGQIERVDSLAESRKSFRSGPLIDLPAALQPAASSLVDRALLAAAHAALAQGMKVVEAEAPNQVSDADRIRVLELRTWMQSIGARDELAPLDAALTTDALTRLNMLDQSLAEAQLYVARDADFDNWSGQAGPLLDAFGGGDGVGVLAYVERQKEFIDAITRQSEGVVKFLTGIGASGATPLVSRWRRQAADLQLYSRKSPLSSRLALETFILEDSAAIDGANCADKLTARKALSGTDVYAVRLQVLKTALLARCRALAGGANERSWQRFALAYNNDLGKRPPFVDVASGVAPDAMPAERDAVGAALRNYDLARAASVQAARDRGQSGARAEVKAAEQEFGRVRDLLAPLFPPDDSQPAALDLSIDFRVNKAAEQRANTIIEWWLAVGPATLRQGEPARTLRWESGMPVVLNLRLAGDGPVAPDPGSGARRPNMAVVGRTVSFRFDDPWALFTFVQTFRVADPAGDDGRAPLLRVEFPVLAAGTAVPLAPQSTVQLYLRARVRAPGKQTTLPWPAAFPEQLPLWPLPVKKDPT